MIWFDFIGVNIAVGYVVVVVGGGAVDDVTRFVAGVVIEASVGVMVEVLLLMWVIPWLEPRWPKYDEDISKYSHLALSVVIQLRYQ